ncbi:MAG: YceK/YidQ family lipoprotein [Planctomycetota bacterium]|nr:YceK/YidQ family lipoprotein [Planctomycetota bacterium]
MTFLRYLFIAVIVTSLSACGTSVNLVAKGKPYGGVVLDATMAGAAGVEGLPLTVAAAADMPLSFVGDTVTAPLLIGND